MAFGLFYRQSPIWRKPILQHRLNSWKVTRSVIFTVLSFSSNCIFTSVYIIYINKLHNGNTLVVLHLSHFPIDLVLFFFLSVCDSYSYHMPYISHSSEIQILCAMMHLNAQIQSAHDAFSLKWSYFLTDVESGFGGVGSIFPYFTRQALCAVTPLENFQPVRALLALFGTDFPLVEHWLADFGPEVTSTAKTFHAVWWSQAGVSFVPCRMMTKIYHLSTSEKFYFAIRALKVFYLCYLP